MQEIRDAGLEFERLQNNKEYRFVSSRAEKAVTKWGVKSISLLAIKR